MYNQNAPAALQANYARQRGDDPFDYLVDVVLSANEVRQVTVDIDADAEFVARALFVAAATGAFKMRWSDSRQYYTSNERIASANLSADGAAPYPIYPELAIPANGRITLDLEDTSGAGNTLQIVFRGCKRFR